MPTKDFETELDLGLLKTGTIAGGITNVLLEEKDANGIYNHSHIIRTDHDWRINVSWALRGTLLDSRFLDIPGKWVLKTYLEGWGKDAEEIDRDGDHGGIEVTPAQTVVKAGSLGMNDPLETEWQYMETFTFAPKAVKPGAYRLAVAITYRDENDVPGPMAGFIEVEDMIQIYDPGT